MGYLSPQALVIWHVKCYPDGYSLLGLQSLQGLEKPKLNGEQEAWDDPEGSRTEREDGKTNGERGRTMRTSIAKSSEEGLRKGWTRATFILRKDYLEKVKGLAYWKRKKMKEVFDEALGAYLRGKKIEH